MLKSSKFLKRDGAEGDASVGAVDSAYVGERIREWQSIERRSLGQVLVDQGVLTPEQVRTAGPHTVIFTLSQPYAPFLSTLTQLFVVNRDQVLANKKPLAGSAAAYATANVLSRAPPSATCSSHWGLSVSEPSR